MSISPLKIPETLLELKSEIILWTCLVLLVLTLFIYYHWKRRQLYKLARKIPGPEGWPLIGILLDFTGGPPGIYDTLLNYFNSHPNLYKSWLGPQLLFGISKPDYVETVLTSRKALSKMYLYKFAEPLVGQGLFTAPVPVWKRHRRIIAPAFNQKILEGFVEIFGTQSTILCEQLEKYVGKGEFDVIHELNNCTLDTLCETAMGVSANTQTTNSSFGQMIERMKEIGFLRMSVPWYQLDFIFQRTKLHREGIQLAEKFQQFTGEVIRDRRQNTKFVVTKRKPFLDLLLELSASDDTKLTEIEVRDEVNTFMIAGSDTDASAIGFFFVMLAMHPHIQEKVFQETISVLGPERTAEPQDLPLMKYTERTIKETLRLFPMGAFVGRDIKEDLPLGDGVVLPKGSSVLLGIIHVHRNGNIWPNPLNFDPDRFLPEEVAKRHPYAFLPFLGGLRNCIGSKYAMMSIMTIAASVIRIFKFKTSYKNVEDVKLKFNLMLRPREGYKISLEMRK